MTVVDGEVVYEKGERVNRSATTAMPAMWRRSEPTLMASERRCPSCYRVTRIADDMVDREVTCPGCGIPIPVTARETNPYAPPSAPRSRVELSEVPPVVPTSTLAKFGEAFRLLGSNLGVIGPLVLTVWLPGNLLINYLVPG